MRISDWSSDVCSSDLVPPGWPGPAPRVDAAEAAQANETLKEVAAAYLILTLEAGAHEQGYVDAYYGPPKLIADALTAPRGVPVLEAEARRLIARIARSEEHTSELQSLMRHSYAG